MRAFACSANLRTVGEKLRLQIAAMGQHQSAAEGACDMSVSEESMGSEETGSSSMSHKDAKIEAAAAKARAKAARPLYLKKRVLIPGILAVIAVIGSVTGGDSGNGGTAAPSSTASSSSSTTAAPSAPPAASSNLTRSQQNAIRSAEDYLSFTAFSRKGLIEQLQFEGYSTEDATLAVDSIVVDWKEQAAKSAENYLSFTAFSRSGLIDQLVFEGFTREEAEHGVNEAGL